MRFALYRAFLISTALVAGAAACSSSGNTTSATGTGTSSGGAASTGVGGGFMATGASTGTMSTSTGATTGSGGCGLYQVSCNGVCTSTSDPKNCGGCGITCPPTQVCSAGGCTGACLPGLDKCNGTCADLKSDDANCGVCGHACPTGQGCVNGTCEAALTFTPPSICANGGPPNMVSNGTKTDCVGNIAQTSFDWGICSCIDANLSSTVFIDGWDSTSGPYKPGTMGGGLGANNMVVGSSNVDIWGPLWGGAQTGKTFDFSSHCKVHLDLESGADITASDLQVTHDAYVGGNIDGMMTVGHTLYQSPGKTNNLATAGNIVMQPVNVKPPCDCTNKLPIAAWVAWGKAHNDNALIGLDPAVLTKANHPNRIDLPCGEYYLDGFTLSGAAAIVAHGATVIFVDGDINASSFLSMQPADSNSSIDVFVSGTVTASADFKLGSANWPALTRLYLGTTAQFDLSSTTIIGGEVWAGYAKVNWSSNADMFGAIFGNDFNISAPLNLHHDEGITKAGKTCNNNPGCGSCKDCGNQACINGQCGACQSSADCCAPLQCVNGTCVPVIM